MLYSRVYIDTICYELAPNVVTSKEIEKRLAPVYDALHLKIGQFEAMTGIRERRFWNPEDRLNEGAAKAGQKAIEASGISPEDIEMLIYASVCKDKLEPATACAVADQLKLSASTQIYDVSNACLGVLTGMVQVANAIELGQIRAGLIVACEASRQIVETTINRLLKNKSMELFKSIIATLTGGSGAVAVLLTDGSFSNQGHRMLGGVIRNASQHHDLCIWGENPEKRDRCFNFTQTDAASVMQNGVALGTETFKYFKEEMNWDETRPDKIICHQVGASNQKSILKALNISPERDFTTYQYLGNIGTVSLPITAAIANERGFLNQEDLVGFLGIGSGLNCLMLGVRW
ncbi:Acyl-CoA:acyl-CoA alkyltransferase [Candidatus Magnetomoraceae bacterium gMMP-15]